MRPLEPILGILTVLTLILGVEGCVNLDPRLDPTRTFVLQSVPSETETPSGHEGGISIGLERIEIPRYLRTPKMAVRRGHHEIDYSEFNRWGEPLDEAIGRTVATNLEAHPLVKRVSVFPWREDFSTHDVTIRIRVQEFEGSETLKAILRAQWEIVRPGENLRMHAGRTEVDLDWDGKDYAALAQDLSEALETLSEELITALLQSSTKIVSWSSSEAALRQPFIALKKSP